MKRLLFLILLSVFVFVGCKEEVVVTVPDGSVVNQEYEDKTDAARAKKDMELAEESARIGVGLIKVIDDGGGGWVKQITFSDGTVAVDGSDATVTVAGVSPGSGSVTTVQEEDAAGGSSDADIVTIDFQEAFAVTEAPDTEVNIFLDVTPGTGNATLVVEDDAVQVLYDTTDFGEAAVTGLQLGASPTIATSLAIGTDPADAGALRLANAGYIYSEADATGTDISVIGVDSSEVVQIAASGASGVTITPTVTVTGDVIVAGDDISLDAAGVKLSGANGALTILGLGDGQDEDVKIDLNSTENTIEITSPASSATTVDLNTLNLLLTGTVTSGDIIHGADPADAGDIRLSNAETIAWEASAAGTDIVGISVDASEVVQIASSGASGVTITPALTLSSTLTDGTATLTSGAWSGVSTIAMTGALSGVTTIVAGTSIEAPFFVTGSAATAADAGAIRLANTNDIAWEADAAGTDVVGISVDASEVVQIAPSGASGVTITPNLTLSGTLTDGTATLSSGAWSAITTIGASGDITTTEDLVIGDAKYIGSTTDKLAIQIEADGDIVLTDDITVGGGNINTGNIALTVGDATTDTITFTTDGTGDAEIVLRNDSVGDAEIDWEGLTASHIFTSPGIVLTAEGVVDELGLEFTPTDNASLDDCSLFASGSGIFYDDSDNKFKKCMEGALTDLDTDTGGAPALSAVTAPTTVWSVAFDDGETVTWAGANDNETFVTIQLSAADLSAATTALEITATDNDDTDYVPFAIYDDDGGDNDQLFKIGSTGAISIGEAPATTGTAINLPNASTIVWLDATPASITHVDNTSLAVNVALDITGAGGLILSNDETITNATDGTVSFSGGIAIPDAGNIGSASDLDAIVIAADGKTTFSQDMNLSEDLLIGDTKYIGSASDPDAAQIAANGEITLTQELQAGVGIDATGQTIIASAFTGTASLATTVTVSDDESTNDGQEVVFTTDNANLESDGDFSYNPSTGTLTVPNLDVLGAPLPADPGADRVLAWDDSETGAELIWSSVGSGDVLADGSVPFTGEVTITAAAPALTFLDSDSADGTATLSFQATGANEIVASLQTDVAGTPTTFIELDGITATVDVLKDLAIGANPADAGTGIRMSNNTVIEFEDSENTGEVTALQVDSAELITIGDANASGLALIPATTVTGVLTTSAMLTASIGITTTDVGVILSDAAAIDQSANNLVEITENSDSIQFAFNGTDLGIVWSDGALNLDTAEDADSVVNITGGSATKKGELRVLSAGGDKHVALYHNDTNSLVYSSSGNILLAADADTDDYIMVDTTTNVPSISPDSDDGGTLGTSSIGWSDAYFADGAVINGRTTITDGAGGWTFSGTIAATDATFTGTTTVSTLTQAATATPTWTASDSSTTATGTFDIKVDAATGDGAGATADYGAQIRFYVDEGDGTEVDGAEDVLFMTINGNADNSEAEGTIEFERIGNFEMGLSSSNGTTSAGFIDLYNDEDEATYKLRLQPAVMAGDVTLTFPNTDGGANEILTTDGNGVLSWTSAGAATKWSDIADPTNNGTKTITFDNAAEATVLSTAYDTAGSFFKIDNTDADHANNTYLLDLDYSVDDGDVDADYIKAQDAGGTVFTLQQDGDIATTGTVIATGGFFPTTTSGAALGSDTLDFSDIFLADAAVINFDSGDVTITHTAETLTVAGGDLAVTTLNGHTFTPGSSTFTGTAAQTYTFPTTSATIARTDAANTFTGIQTMTAAALTSPVITTGIELNHATENTLTAASGVLSVEGVRVAYVLNPVVDTCANFAGNFTGVNLYGGHFIGTTTGTSTLPAAGSLIQFAYSVDTGQTATVNRAGSDTMTLSYLVDGTPTQTASRCSIADN